MKTKSIFLMIIFEAALLGSLLVHTSNTSLIINARYTLMRNILILISIIALRCLFDSVYDKLYSEAKGDNRIHLVSMYSKIKVVISIVLLCEVIIIALNLAVIIFVK